MLCRICKSKGKRTKASIYIRHHRLALCKEHFIEWFEKQTAKTIKEFNMFSKDEKVLIAVSGGKDSLSLWYALHRLGYKTYGFHISLGIEGWEYSKKSLDICKKFSERIERPLIIFDIKDEFGYSIEEIAKGSGRKDVCSVCGTFKRYLMNKICKEQGFKVVATGHNLDDESALLLSNTIRWEIGYLGRQHPVLPEKNGFARKVKPFVFFTEKEIVSYAILNKIEYLETGCPNAKEATSILYKRSLAMLEHEMPGTKLRFYKEFLKKARPIFEKELKEHLELNECKICKMPTTASICSVCRTLERLKINVKSR
ncbi:PP-loop domain protein [Desulfurobacterium thermolithotrophum DSM 11699]|uniref:PP-loop domain protein n=1 Tax=Desulfurobacterium thermolithotrophum (strain DSM 11699 / BSA) TaxID=868864 RepID=F0S370_DESTD|nr:ATP-binding protein [Desulfurobacterium thermolithotrophum]ADY73292.1 PP-loop domain protein [Desulfurobacterium thermolithotrophum DSM 11699]